MLEIPRDQAMIPGMNLVQALQRLISEEPRNTRELIRARYALEQDAPGAQEKAVRAIRRSLVSLNRNPELLVEMAEWLPATVASPPRAPRARSPGRPRTHCTLAVRIGLARAQHWAAWAQHHHLELDALMEQVMDERTGYAPSETTIPAIAATVSSFA